MFYWGKRTNMILSIIPKDFIINASSENGGKVISNFLLHGLKITNNSDGNIVLKAINFELHSSGNFVKQVSYCGKSLETVMNESLPNAKWLEKGFCAGLYLGEDGFWSQELHEASVELKPNQERGMFNEYFIVVYDKIIDEMIISVDYDKNSEHCSQELRVALIKYENKNQYIFPLKGNISTCGNYNSLPEHRQHYSMEFAFDMAQYNTDQKLCYKDHMQEQDYVVYGKEVFAIADGEVVDCYHDFSMTTSWNWAERKPLIDKYGLAAQCGNHVIIKHANGEYSFYGHLIAYSLTVKKGDKITQGQAIAKVGHTGLSGCPHLHFQLMNGPDFLASRGLPCSFTNLKDVTGEKISFIQEENIIVHAE
jgi:hypothetical protein